MTILTTYRNPILPGFNPDPSIIQVNGDYFLTTSTFEYFPGLPIYHSRNLIDWEIIGHVLTRKSQLDMRTTEAGGGVYAPCLRYKEGRFYVATAVVHRRSSMTSQDVSTKHPTRADLKTSPGSRGFIVWTDDIWKRGSWSDSIWLDTLGIDQDVGRYSGDKLPTH